MNTFSDAEKWTRICYVCGSSSENHCAKCKKTDYCSRVHQVFDWKNGHKDLCGTEKEVESKSILFPEFELVVETEEEEEGAISEIEAQNDDLEKERQEIQKYEEHVASVHAGSLQFEPNVDSDLIQLANMIEDDTFDEFTEQIKNDPDQVLR